MPGRVAGPPISGHVELATLPDIGTPAPCQSRPGAPLASRGDFFASSKSDRVLNHGKRKLAIKFLYFYANGFDLDKSKGIVQNSLPIFTPL
jgi:hypothetical protein